MKPASYQKHLSDGKIQCKLCPHNCILDNGNTGKCRVRFNRNAELYTHNYGLVSALHLDPIEKKPLYHYFPGKQILSVGSFGCNMHCSFCQNSTISQCESPDLYKGHYKSPQQIISAALETPDNIGIAYTYNEPAIWYEFMADIAQKAASEKLRNVMITNGYINPKPFIDLLPFIDALNIDLKAFSDYFYREQTGARLAPVLETLKLAAQAGKHLEITILIIPDLNDDIDEFKELLSFIVNECGKNTVLHLSRYFPAYKLNKPITPEQTLKTLFEEAKKNLNFVYLGNISTEYGKDTFCPNCNTKVIERKGYKTNIMKLDKYGCCSNCAYQLLKNL